MLSDDSDEDAILREPLPREEVAVTEALMMSESFTPSAETVSDAPFKFFDEP